MGQVSTRQLEIMKKYTLYLSIFLFHSTIVAGGTTYAMKIDLKDDFEVGATLDISADQAFLHEALIEYCPGFNIGMLSEKEYMGLVNAYVEDHIQIYADGTPLIASEGEIHRSHRRCDLNFKIENYPTNTNELCVEVGNPMDNSNDLLEFGWLTKNQKVRTELTPQKGYKSKLYLNASMPSTDDFVTGNLLSGAGMIALYSLIYWLILSNIWTARGVNPPHTHRLRME